MIFYRPEGSTRQRWMESHRRSEYFERMENGHTGEFRNPPAAGLRITDHIINTGISYLREQRLTHLMGHIESLLLDAIGPGNTAALRVRKLDLKIRDPAQDAECRDADAMAAELARRMVKNFHGHRFQIMIFERLPQSVNDKFKHIKTSLGDFIHIRSIQSQHRPIFMLELEDAGRRRADDGNFLTYEGQ